MSIASHASPAVQAAAVLSTVMFAPGDEVKAKSSMLPFWMTVISVNERTGFCRCNFGRTDRYAGNFHQGELRFNGGTELELAAG